MGIAHQSLKVYLSSFVGKALIHAMNSMPYLGAVAIHSLDRYISMEKNIP
jgi:hypothetical protein